NAWTMPQTGLWVINNYGYGHSNLKVDLSKVDPAVVRAFGLDDPVGNLSPPAALMDRYQPQRDAYNRAWDEVKAALASGDRARPLDRDRAEGAAGPVPAPAGAPGRGHGGPPVRP